MPESKKTFFLGSEYCLLGSVYEPSEDSELLIASVKVNKNDFVLDLGTGTGIQAINALMNGAKKVLCTDINADALNCAEVNLKKSGLVHLTEFRKSNLFSEIPEKFDLIIFNTPYVLSDEIKYKELDGGIKGREILDKFLNEFSNHLNSDGKAFFIQTDLNDLTETKKILSGKGFECEVIAEKKLFFEKLLVLKAFRK